MLGLVFMDLAPFGHAMCPEEIQAFAHGLLQCGWTSDALHGKVRCDIVCALEDPGGKGALQQILLVPTW